MSVDAAPDVGSGNAEADACNDAKPFGSTATPVTIDTFQAKGDTKVSCAADAAADVVYQVHRDDPRGRTLRCRPTDD